MRHWSLRPQYTSSGGGGGESFGFDLGNQDGGTPSTPTDPGDIILIPTVPEPPPIPPDSDGGGPIPTPAPVYVAIIQIKIGTVPSPNKKIKPVIYDGAGDSKKKVVVGQELTITSAMANTTQNIVLTIPAALQPGQTYYIGIQSDGDFVYMTDPTGTSIVYTSTYADGVPNTVDTATVRPGKAAIFAKGTLRPMTANTLAISGSPATTGTTGIAYSFTPTVTGGTAPYAFDLSAGTLPDGLELDPDFGTISGTPTTPETQNGITLRVTDSGSPVQTKSLAPFNLAISPLAPAFVATGGYGGSASGSTGNITLPADIQANDILLMPVFVANTSGGTVTINTPSGWTAVSAQVTLVGGEDLKFFWKRAAGGESGTVTVTSSGGLGGALSFTKGEICSYRNCIATGTPFEAVGEAHNSAGTANTAGPDVITTGANRAVVAACFVDFEVTSAQPSGWTDRVNATSGHSFASFSDRAQATAATVPGMVRAAQNWRWVVWGLALIPIGG
jgi:Putative Ig domain